MIRWFSDTCFCVLIVEKDFSKVVTVEKKCELHKDIDDRLILSEVQNLNKFYNLKLLDTATKEDIEANTILKFQEKQKTRRIS